MNYLELLRLVLPEVHVAVTALVVLTLGLSRWRSAELLTAISAAGLLLAGYAVFRLPDDVALLGGMVVVTPLTSHFKLISLALGLLTVLLAHRDRDSTRHHAEYLAMILFAAVGLMLLVGSEELLMIFIGLELTGLSLYVLTGFNKADRASAEASLKYFLFGSTASAFTLFGLSLVYGMTGSTALAEIGGKLEAGPLPPLLIAGLVMTLVGFAFKVAAAPFHLWAPDTYQAAPISSAAFIASGSKVASFFILGKLLLLGFAPVDGSAAWQGFAAGWSPLLAVLAAASILLGNFAALAQTNVRRLLAYSAVAHAGYTLLGIIAGGRDGFGATLFYTTTYAVTLIGAFGVVGYVRRSSGGESFAHFAGLSRRSPLLAGAMAIFMLSLAGLPPLAGFFGKFFLFAATLRAEPGHGLLWLIALALFGSLVSLYYYLLVLKAIFLDEQGTAATDSSGEMLPRAVIGFCAALVLLLGFWPTPLLQSILATLG